MIQESLAVEQLNKLDPVTQALQPVVFAPQEYKAHNLEQYLEARLRARGTFTTAVIPAFVTYVNEEAVNNAGEKLARCFVDDENLSAVAVFNFAHPEHEQGHCDNRATIRLKRTAVYQVLCDMSGSRIAQQGAAEFIEDYANYITAYDEAGAEMKLSRVVSTLRKLKIEAKRDSEHTVENFNQSRSLMESIEAKGDALPHTLSFSCEPYAGLGDYSISLRLSVIAGEAPVFVFRIIKPEELHQEFAEHFTQILTDGVDKQWCDVFMGSFSA